MPFLRSEEIKIFHQISFVLFVIIISHRRSANKIQHIIVIFTKSFVARDRFGVPGDGEFTSPVNADHVAGVLALLSLPLVFIVSVSLSLSLYASLSLSLNCPTCQKIKLKDTVTSNKSLIIFRVLFSCLMMEGVRQDGSFWTLTALILGFSSSMRLL